MSNSDSVEYLRQSHNLANNLLGKASPNEQPTLFGEWLARSGGAPVEGEEQVELIGFDLLAAEQRAVEAVLRLVAQGGYRTPFLRFGIVEWLEAYGVEKSRNANGWMDHSGKERLQAITALEGVGSRSGVILHSRRRENGHYDVVRSIGPLWQIEEGFEDLSPEERGKLGAGRLTPQIAAKLKKFHITLNKVFFCEPDTPYFYRPANLWNRMQQALGPGVRTPAHTYNFLTWLFAQAVERRGHHDPKEPLTLSVAFDDLAHACRLHKELAAGRRKRITESFDKDARIAREMHLLTDYNLSDPRAMTFTFDAGSVFAAIDDWNQRQLRKLPAGTNRTGKFAADRGAEGRRTSATAAEVVPVDLATMLPSQLERLIKEVAQKIQAIKGRRKRGYDRVTGKDDVLLVDNTPEEKEALGVLQARLGEARKRLYGTSV